MKGIHCQEKNDKFFHFCADFHVWKSERLRHEEEEKLSLFISPDYYIKGMKVTTDEKPTRVTSTWVFSFSNRY